MSACPRLGGLSGPWCPRTRAHGALLRQRRGSLAMCSGPPPSVPKLPDRHLTACEARLKRQVWPRRPLGQLCQRDGSAEWRGTHAPELTVITHGPSGGAAGSRDSPSLGAQLPLPLQVLRGPAVPSDNCSPVTVSSLTSSNSRWIPAADQGPGLTGGSLAVVKSATGQGGEGVTGPTPHTQRDSQPGT